MDYYQIKQYIAEVNRNDEIIGKLEKWDAHRRSVLHRAFTVILVYENNYVLQHRKHPVFDKCYDLSFSSHQLYVDGTLQTDLEAIYSSLKREWNVEREGLKNSPIKIGQIYYKAKDPKSEYSDHEIDYIYKAELKNKPDINPDFAYGFQIISQNELLSGKLEKKYNLAPWVKQMIHSQVI